MYLMTHTPKESSNQPAHPHRLIRVVFDHKKKLCILGYPNSTNPSNDANRDCANVHMSEDEFSNVTAYMYKSKGLPLETKNTQNHENRRLGFICNTVVCEAAYAP